MSERSDRYYRLVAKWESKTAPHAVSFKEAKAIAARCEKNERWLKREEKERRKQEKAAERQVTKSANLKTAVLKKKATAKKLPFQRERLSAGDVQWKTANGSHTKTHDYYYSNATIVRFKAKDGNEVLDPEQCKRKQEELRIYKLRPKRAHLSFGQTGTLAHILKSVYEDALRLGKEMSAYRAELKRCDVMSIFHSSLKDQRYDHETNEPQRYCTLFLKQTAEIPETVEELADVIATPPMSWEEIDAEWSRRQQQVDETK